MLDKQKKKMKSYVRFVGNSVFMLLAEINYTFLYNEWPLIGNIMGSVKTFNFPFISFFSILESTPNKSPLCFFTLMIQEIMTKISNMLLEKSKKGVSVHQLHMPM